MSAVTDLEMAVICHRVIQKMEINKDNITMKKYLIIIMAALFAVACSDKQEEVAPAPAVEQYQFTVSVNQGESSRAFLQDLAKIFWKIHDKITLYAKSYKDSSKKVELEAQEVSDAAAK